MNLGLSLFASAGSIGMHSPYASISVHYGIGVTLGYNDGTLKLGVALGPGISISINFKKIGKWLKSLFR